MEGYQDDTAEFNSEDVEQYVRKAIQSVALNEAQYNPKKVNEWTNGIVTSVLKDLQQLGRPFKYIITCIITQNIGAGMHTSASMYWDVSKDGHCKLGWRNNTIHCIVTVYGVSVNIDDPQDVDM